MNGLKFWIPLVPLLIAGALGAGNKTAQNPDQATVKKVDCPFAFGCVEPQPTPARD